MWFLVGATIVALSATAWELLRYEGLGDIPLVVLIVLAPGYFVSIWFTMLGAPSTYFLGAVCNGTIYAALAWSVSRVPPGRKLLRAAIVILPFLPVWSMFIYSEFFT